jgi:hypothetical protein
MIDEIQKLLDNYIMWLKDKTTLREFKDWVEITTPYLDRHNDYLQIYAQKRNGGYLLTDDGYILEDLKESGCKLESQKRLDLLKITLNGFGVHLDSNRLEITASPENFALKKHNLVQAMLAVNDLFYLSQAYVESIFWEDVAAWLDLCDIRYTPRVKFTGKSGYDHLFDFVIPKSKKQPERIIQTLNKPNKDTAEALVFAWIDTREVRSPNSSVFAFLNDTEHSISQNVIDALKNYGLYPVFWSEREEVREKLAA